VGVPAQGTSREVRGAVGRPEDVVPAAIVRAFDNRRAFFTAESMWSADETLITACAEMVVGEVPAEEFPLEVLDYGAGVGVVGRCLTERGLVVDVADVSPEMLRACEFARRRFLVPEETVLGPYDGIVLRQVLQYVGCEQWEQFVWSLLGLLRPAGRLLFSQIVPVCDVDAGFWRQLTATGRPERQSFPTENEFLRLCERTGAKVTAFRESRTRQSLRAWIERAPVATQRGIEELFRLSSNAVRALWEIEYQEHGDILWTNRWVHVLVAPSNPKPVHVEAGHGP